MTHFKSGVNACINFMIYSIVSDNFYQKNMGMLQVEP